MAKFTPEELSELESLIRNYHNRMANVDKVSRGIRHPIFRDRTIEIPVTPEEQAQLNSSVNQAENALFQKIQQLAAKP